MPLTRRGSINNRAHNLTLTMHWRRRPFRHRLKMVRSSTWCRRFSKRPSLTKGLSFARLKSLERSTAKAKACFPAQNNPITHRMTLMVSASKVRCFRKRQRTLARISLFPLPKPIFKSPFSSLKTCTFSLKSWTLCGRIRNRRLAGVTSA